MVLLESMDNYRPVKDCGTIEPCEERHRLEHTLDELQQKCSSVEDEANNMRDYIVQQEEHKKRLTQRIEKLCANERALVKELGRIGRQNGGAVGTRLTECSGIMDEHLHGLEADKDYLREQVDFLQNLLTNPSLSQGGRGNSPSRSVLGKMKTKPPTGRCGSTSLKSGTPLKQQQQHQNQRKMELQIQELTADREQLRYELERLKRFQIRSPSPLTRSKSLTRVHNCDSSFELNRLRRERDDLRRLLDNLEQRVQEIQRNVHTITTERDQVNKLYNDARCEISRLQNDMHEIQHAGDRNSHSNLACLRRAESDRDRALVDLSRVTAERDCLIAKYKKNTSQSNDDRLRLSNQLDQAERNLCHVSVERDDAVKRLADLRQCIDGMHLRQRQLEDSLSERMEHFKLAMEDNDRLRGEIDAQTRNMTVQVNQVKHLTEHLKQVEDDNIFLQSKLEEATTRAHQDQEHANRLHEQIIRLEKDVEHLEQNKSELLKKQRQSEKRLHTLTLENEQQTIKLKEDSENVSTLQSKLENLDRELAELRNRYQVEKSSNEKLVERQESLMQAKLTAERRTSWVEQQLSECQSNLSQVEFQLNTEREQRRWLTENNDKLNEDNKTLLATVDVANSDKTHLEACIEDLRATQRQNARELEEVTQRCNNLRDKAAHFEESYKQAENEASRVTEALRSERTMVSDLQQKLDLSHRRNDASERDVAEANQRLRDTEDQLHKAECRMAHLDRELQHVKEDFAQLKGRSEATQEEKQGLEINLRETAQRLGDTEVELSMKNREVHELRIANEDHTRAINSVQETLSIKNAEIFALKREVTTLQTNLTDMRHLKESQERECARLNESVSKLSSDNQTLGSKLRETNDDKEENVRRCKDYLKDLSRQERMLGERDSECQSLMDKLRCATEEAESWRARWEVAEGKAATARCDADDNETHLLAERDKAEMRERELIQLKAHLNAIEMENSTLSRTTAELNEKLKIGQAELEALGTEVNRLRDSLSRIESERSAAQREASNFRLESDQLRAQLDDLELEVEQQKQVIERERSNSRNMQTSLQSCRQKEQSNSQEMQDKNNEIAALRERLIAIEDRAETVLRESERLRERLCEADREVSRLTRALSTERFEKEKALSELRLSSLPSCYRPSGYTSYSGAATAPTRERLPYNERQDY